MESILTQSTSKSFGEKLVIDAISMQVNQGEIYGFLGLNGAGKTTFIRLLLGMLRADAGDIKLFDKDLTGSFDAWNDIGYLVETPLSYPDLNIVENLKVYHKLRQLSDKSLIDHIIDQLKLTPFKNTPARHLSLGNQQRLGLAKALMHKPRLLILDEPINGLDPEGIVEVRDLLKELAAGGSTIFLSSHILSEISKLASRIGIIHEGRLIRELTIPELNKELIRKVFLKTNDLTRASEILRVAGIACEKDKEDQLVLQDTQALTQPEKITALLTENGQPPSQIYVHTEDLEHYFLRTIKTRNS